MIKNILKSSGQSINIALGQSYVLKDDEVLINNHTYKKNDLEIYLPSLNEDFEQEKVPLGIRLRDGLKGIPASSSIYNEWEIDGVVQTSLSSCFSNIQSSIVNPVNASVGATESTAQAILSGITGINNTLTNNTNSLMEEVRDSNIAQEALISSTNNFIIGVRTDLSNLLSQQFITSTELIDANSELDNISSQLNGIQSGDSTFYSDLLSSQNLIQSLLGNIGGNTVDINSGLDSTNLKLDTLITQTNQVESFLLTINNTLTSFQNFNASQLEQLRLLLSSIDANTDALESELINIINEHDQTQVLLTQLNSSISITNSLLGNVASINGVIQSSLGKSNETQVLVSGTNTNIPTGMKSVTISRLSGTNILTLDNGNTFELGGGSRPRAITIDGSSLQGKNGIIEGISISGGTWQWIGQSNFTNL